MLDFLAQMSIVFHAQTSQQFNAFVIWLAE
jgi:hypothetical protein